MQQMPLSENGPFPTVPAPSPSTDRPTDKSLGGSLSVSPHNGSARQSTWPHATGQSNGHGSHAGTANAAARGDFRLTELVGRAEMSIGELERLARTTLDATAAASQAAADLQERLRLGVRMLQAFDVQIDRSQQAAGQVQAQLHPQMLQQVVLQVQAQLHAHMQAQMQAQMAGLGQQAEMRLRAVTEACERRFGEAIAAIDERIAATERSFETRVGTAQDALRHRADELMAGCAERLESLAATRAEIAPGEQRTATSLADGEDRVRTLLAEIERRAAGIEATVGRAEERLRQLNRQSVEAADGLLGTVGTATTLKDLVADEARTSKRLADEAAATTRELQSELAGLLERCTTTRATLDRDLTSFVDAARSVESRTSAVRALQGELDALLTRLGPWESMVRRDIQPASHVMETISTTVRRSLAEEMKGFSSALRSLASRAETAFATGRFDEFSAVTDAIESSVPADPPTAGVPEPPAPSQRTTVLPLDTHRLTAEIMALENTTLLRPTDTHVA